MTSLVDKNRKLIFELGLQANFFTLLDDAGVITIDGYCGYLINDAMKRHGNNGANFSVNYLRAMCNAFQFYQTSKLCAWVSCMVERLCSNRYDGERSDFSELEAYGHLSSIFYDQDVVQLDEKGGKKGKTPDFKIGNDLFVEVYCPDESHVERKRVQEELSKQSGMIKTVMSRPVTGSKPAAVQYATNQTIARILGAKRGNDQTQAGAKNVLWVDIKHKLNLSVKTVLPLESLNHANQTFIGSFGVWHSFYGEVGMSVFAKERYTLKFDGDLFSHSYKQHQYTGLFRDRSALSAAVVSCLDGNVLFLNPWCANPLSDTDVHCFKKLHQFRPEYSFFVKSTLVTDIASKEIMIAFLLGKA